MSHAPNQATALVTWLRCPQCHHGYFLVGAPCPQPCPTCSGGRLHPVGIWDLTHEPAPAGMRWCGEVAHELAIAINGLRERLGEGRV
jgi:hypothetical protein